MKSMPEFKMEIFPQQDFRRIENWLNTMKRGGYFVRVESSVVNRNNEIIVVIFRYIPSKNGMPAGDVSQPEPWKEPVIGDEED